MKKILCVVLMLLIVFSCGAKVARAEETTAQLTLGELLTLRNEVNAMLVKLDEAITMAKKDGNAIPFYPGNYLCGENGIKPGTYIFYPTKTTGSYKSVDIDIYNEDGSWQGNIGADNLDPVVFSVTEGQMLRLRYASGYLMKPQF